MIKDLADLNALEHHHQRNCEIYRTYALQEFPGSGVATRIEDFPFLPVAAFKNYDLKSVSDSEVIKVMSSSGTSGARSQIYLDKATARGQIEGLTATLVKEFGKARFPMVFVQGEDAAGDQFTASKAAVNGFSVMARTSLVLPCNPNESELAHLINLSAAKNDPPLIFGFTYNVWKLIGALEGRGVSNALPNSTILHGGGWKKLQDKRVSSEEFGDRAREVLGVSRVTNYYGLVEQTGSIFMECKNGNMHEPENGALLIRDESTLKPLGPGRSGFIQVISTLQKSYPGHSVLTEDLGLWIEASDCGCENPGRILKVIGRAKGAEIRGCSDAQLS
jgi:phenylacetate-coenzyme A ligase PaaK-like adenylate-forming protein